MLVFCLFIAPPQSLALVLAPVYSPGPNTCWWSLPSCPVSPVGTPRPAPWWAERSQVGGGGRSLEGWRRMGPVKTLTWKILFPPSCFWGNEI